MNIKTFVLLLLFIVPAHSQTIKNAIPDVARPLPLSSVRITGGPLKRAQDLNADYLLKLEPDRMMAYYRKRAGRQPKAEGYPGWDGDGKNLTGHIAGHYLSGVQKFVNERDSFTIPLARSPISIELVRQL